MKTTQGKAFFTLSLVILLTAVLLGGCDSALEEDVYSELSPGNFLTTEEGINSVLTGAYGEVQHHGGREFFFTLTELPTDILIDREGGLEALARPLMDFTWDSSHPFFAGLWTQLYEAIRNANLVLGNLEQVDMPEERKQQVEAEARFVRAKAYVDLYTFFGPAPLFTSSSLEELEKPRATEEEMKTFIEEELRAVAAVLPLEQADYGRATRGAALGVLTKFLLNTRQWQTSADAAQQVMDLGIYALVEDRVALFDPANEQNSEFIYVTPEIPQPGACNGALPHVVPDNYAFKYPPGTIWGTEFITPHPFYESFAPDDERREMIITEFVNTEGELVQLDEDNIRALKYQEDPNKFSGSCAGNDENAQARGKTAAEPHHVRYPIPQVEVDANSEIEQNPGY